MTLKAVNHYPVAINATVVLANAAGQPLLTYGLGTVPAGDSVSVPASLAGKIVPSQLKFNLTSFSSPGAGTLGVPSTYVPIDTNANLTAGLPANLDRLNVNVGLHWMLYEKTYRKNAKARRTAKKGQAGRT